MPLRWWHNDNALTKVGFSVAKMIPLPETDIQYPLLNAMVRKVKQWVVTYIASDRLTARVANVYSSLQGAERACKQIGGAAGPLCYLLTAGGIFLVLSNKIPTGRQP
jgi:hypothetical protein